MIFLKRPTSEVINAQIATLENVPTTYQPIDGGFQGTPKGFNLDEHRVLLGYGRKIYDRGKLALRDWRMMDMDWIAIWPKKPPLSEETVVSILVRVLGIWILNMARIVKCVDSQGSNNDQFGFSYGTLEQHVEQGEEEFLVTWNHPDDSVWFSIKAFSRPGRLLVWIGYPYVRYLQKRFANDAMAAFLKAVL